MQEDLFCLVKEYGRDILISENHRLSKNHIQHGTMPVRSHSIIVALKCLAFSRALRLRCNQREMVRGALLHDYFLYDWHDKEHVSIFKLHGFFHPGVALKNASREYCLTAREKDIIKKHMWPMTLIPPFYREAWIVTLIDKCCSVVETLRIGPKHQKGRTSHTRGI
jgi:uncharacterized protein